MHYILISLAMNGCTNTEVDDNVNERWLPDSWDVVIAETDIDNVLRLSFDLWLRNRKMC